MRDDVIFDAVTGIDEQLIEEAQPRRRPPSRWKAAAAVAIVVGLGAAAVSQFLGGSHSGPGKRDGTAFMYYTGPVFSLTLAKENDSITAERKITLDFAPWVPEWITNEEDAASRDWLTEEEQQRVVAELEKLYPEGGREERSTDILVTDQYVLTNDSAEDQRVMVRYPYVTTFQDEKIPTMTANGQTVEAETIYGSGAGEFFGVSPEDTEAKNLRNFTSWTDYQALLESGAYLEDAFGPAPDLTKIPVVLYRFTNARYTWDGDEPENPDLVAEFAQDCQVTQVLSYGFNGGSWDGKTGTAAQSCSLQGSAKAKGEETQYLLVIGEDIGPITLRSGFPYPDDTYEVYADIERVETDLDSALREIIDMASEENGGWLGPLTSSKEAFFDGVARAFTQYGGLSKDAAEQYSGGDLETLLGDVSSQNRVVYLQTEITILAGGSVDVEIQMTKEASYDYYGEGARTDVKGYDMTTTLASNLSFTGQTAALLDHGQIEIVRQNFGFDLENGINTVALDLAEPHYYLEVRRTAES